jgi:hypothetical protein
MTYLMANFRTSEIVKKRKKFYFRCLLCSFRNSSSAIVIDGALGLGALISSLKPSCATAHAVVGPNAAIFTSPWTNPGKFSLRDLIPEGL